MSCGTSVCRKYFCKADWKVANIGNAEKTASITVTSGTSEINVVKVRLLAVRPSRSSRKRARSVRSVSSQGQVCSVCTRVGNCSRNSDLVWVVRFIAGIIASDD